MGSSTYALIGGGRLASEIAVKWEVGLRDRGRWDFEVGGINTNYIDNIKII